MENEGQFLYSEIIHKFVKEQKDEIEEINKVNEFKNSLSSIQRQILKLKKEGYSEKGIVEKLNISHEDYQAGFNTLEKKVSKHSNSKPVVLKEKFTIREIEGIFDIPNRTLYNWYKKGEIKPLQKHPLAFSKEEVDKIKKMWTAHREKTKEISHLVNEKGIKRESAYKALSRKKSKKKS